MRTLFVLCLQAGILTACVVKPDRPELSPPLTCQERCDKDADCGGNGACCKDPEACGKDHRCVECTRGDQCDSGACANGACVECTSNSDCASSPFGKSCSPEGTCGECASNEDCRGNPNGGRCAPVSAPEVDCQVLPDHPSCTARYACLCTTAKDCKTPGLGTCRAEGCVCSDDTGCPEFAQKCEAKLGLCYGCADDTQCTGKKTKCFGAGEVSAYCGCTSDEHCDPETDGYAHCAIDTGICVECTGDAQCDSGKKCFNAGTAQASCGCTNNKHCEGSASGSICNTDSGECRQCVSDQDCKAQKLGSVCGTDGTCVCSDVSECGAARSAPSSDWVCEP